MSAEALLAAWVASRCGATGVEVRWLGLALPEQGEVAFGGEPCRKHPDLVARWTDSQGFHEARFKPELRIRVSGPVALQAAQPGEPVRTGPGEVDLTDRVGEPVEGEGWVARVAIAEGQPVTTAVVVRPPDGVNGARVEVVLQRGALRLVAEGRLLEDAQVGDTVRVACEATRATLRGELVAPDRVEVR